jgi:hypothetical protein
MFLVLQTSHSDKSSLAYCLTIFVCHNGTLRVDYYGRNDDTQKEKRSFMAAVTRYASLESTTIQYKYSTSIVLLQYY